MRGSSPFSSPHGPKDADLSIEMTPTCTCQHDHIRECCGCVSPKFEMPFACSLTDRTCPVTNGFQDMFQTFYFFGLFSTLYIFIYENIFSELSPIGMRLCLDDTCIAFSHLHSHSCIFACLMTHRCMCPLKWHRQRTDSSTCSNSPYHVALTSQ